MATYNKFQSWVENMVEVADCGTDQFVLALTAAANAPVNTNAVVADLTQISYTNLSTRNFGGQTSTQTSGTYTLSLPDLVLTASGAVATFRYAVVYDDTPSSPADPLVCWHDYGGNVTLASGETFTYDLTGGLFTVGP